MCCQKRQLESSVSLLTLLIIVDLDSCRRLECIFAIFIWPFQSHYPLQRRSRQHCSLGSGQHDRLSPLDSCVLHRSRLPSSTNRRAVQREPFHCQPSQALSNTLFAIRHAWAVFSGDAQQDNPAFGFSRSHGGTRDKTPPAAAGLASSCTREYPPLFNRRASACGIDDACPRSYCQ